MVWSLPSPTSLDFMIFKDLVFADAQAAFCSIWPELAVGPVMPATQGLAIFRAAGLPDGVAGQLSDAICGGDVELATGAVAEVWRPLLADWHVGS